MGVGAMRISAEVTGDLTYLERLKNYSAEAVINVMDDVTNEALLIAQTNSRVDTGAMRAGWKREGSMAFDGSNELSIMLYNDTVNSRGDAYTQYHEYGTIHFAAQPMLQPAMDYIRQNITSRIADALVGTRGLKTISKSIDVSQISGTMLE